jgi:D-alanine-D-alanine ligase-like ATP-grasp enzyme
VAEGQTFFSEKMNKHLEIQRDIHDGWMFAQQLGLPVIVKPNNLSQGALVNKVDSEEEYYRVAREIFDRTSVMIVERFHVGADYRVVIFDGEVISAYTRIPLNVV